MVTLEEATTEIDSAFSVEDDGILSRFRDLWEGQGDAGALPVPHSRPGRTPLTWKIPVLVEVWPSNEDRGDPSNLK